jgi:hypothetical protein
LGLDLKMKQHKKSAENSMNDEISCAYISSDVFQFLQLRQEN